MFPFNRFYLLPNAASVCKLISKANDLGFLGESGRFGYVSISVVTLREA